MISFHLFYKHFLLIFNNIGIILINFKVYNINDHKKYQIFPLHLFNRSNISKYNKTDKMKEYICIFTYLKMSCSN